MLPEVVRQAKIKRLIQEYQKTDQQWYHYSDIIERLRNSLAGMLEGLAKIQLEKEIESQKAQLPILEDKMAQIEKELVALCPTEKNNSGQLTASLPSENCNYKKSGLDSFLLYIDFLKQVNIFQSFLEISEHKVYAFLLHGSVNYGHIWLLKRLLEAIPHYRAIPPIEYDARNSVYVSDVSKLWRTLAKKVDLPSRASPQAIAQGLAKRLQNQHVIFIFHGMEYMGEAYLHELIQEFWKPLVDSLQKTQCLNSHFQFLMFLIDYQDVISNWQFEFAEEFAQDWQPDIPVKLPRINRFSEEVLRQLQSPFATSVLPRNIFGCPDLVTMILEKTKGGIPGLVLKEIYELCEYDWYEEEEKWQNF